MASFAALCCAGKGSSQAGLLEAGAPPPNVGYEKVAAGEQPPGAGSRGFSASSWPWQKPAGCICCILSIIVLVWVILGAISGYSFTMLCYEPFTGIDSFLHNLNFVCQAGMIAPQMSLCDQAYCGLGDGPMYTPGNVSHSLSLWAPECTSTPLIAAMEAAGRDMPFKVVKYTSRKGDQNQEVLTMSALWLPAKDKNAPRIVWQHGNNVDFNDNSVQITAYLLRSIGFSVLLPNQRYHGVSAADRVGGKIRWGYDLHLDVLGAWDYAVNDPDGHLGGPMNASKVGLGGFSQGGFSTGIAFGLEEAIPALWWDSGVFDPYQELADKIDATVPIPYLLYPAKGLAWSFAQAFAAAPMDRTPETALARDFPAKKGYQPRPVAVVQGTLDKMVPSTQSSSLLNLLEVHHDYYTVALNKRVPYKCGSAFPFPDHCQMSTWRPDDYRSDLCTFWTQAFGLPASHCHLDSLPDFLQCDQEVCTTPPGPARRE